MENLVNLTSLDISGHTMLENCTIPNMEEKMGQTRYGNSNYRGLLGLASWVRDELRTVPTFGLPNSVGLIDSKKQDTTVASS